jgi:surfeit locus 1 family protein
MTKRLIVPLAFGVIGTVVLLALGVWQMQRLEWKLGILERMESRLSGAPSPLPEAPREEDHEYLRVALDGELLPGELHVFVSGGYRVIAPFAMDGRRILLDRGLVPAEDKDAARPTGPLAIEGVLLWPQERDGFTADPDLEANIWFARDVDAMATALGTEPVLVVVGSSEGLAGPEPQPVTTLAIRNPHLGYAVTWFGLAAVWVVMTLSWLWHIKRRTA